MVKTLITAHSGAENTKDNTLDSIRALAQCGADMIEIDVQLHEGVLVMSHDAPEDSADRLEDAFNIVREQPSLRMNLDLKQSGIAGAVAELAEKCGVADRLALTGAVGEEDIPAIRAHHLTVWYNNDAMPADADWLAGVDALGFDGLNLSYEDVTDELEAHADRLSVWTVDGEAMLRRFLELGVKSITTHLPKLALKLREEIQQPPVYKSIKAVTFNIRGDFGVDGENNFYHRKPLILEKVAAEQPDFIGFQEVHPQTAIWLRENLKGYYVVGCGREKKLDGEQMTVAFRADRFNLIEMRTFWLSETPYVPASRYEEQSICPRASTELVLMEYATGRVIRVLNTHLDHQGTGARRLGLRQILRHLDNVELFPDAPVILMGDFNAQPDSEELKVFDEFPGYVSAAEGVGITFHGFMQEEFKECIDYIYIRGAIRCLNAYRWTDERDGVFLSDHYPVCAQLELEQA